ncbi:hypothetical protein CYMTET_23923 [Cymbomonas tetramitiformis]|uniref:Uncharacterized protein n=1 Tax=Cymbomonas tetramitiformis TaxID=36881 RepID=A0AAE0L0F5_9CHLO|nr:hypothetical protein CYMTET_23923 [Cymbomonas tetramitiformis]
MPVQEEGASPAAPPFVLSFPPLKSHRIVGDYRSGALTERTSAQNQGRVAREQARQWISERESHLRMELYKRYKPVMETLITNIKESPEANLATTERLVGLEKQRLKRKVGLEIERTRLEQGWSVNQVQAELRAREEKMGLLAATQATPGVAGGSKIQPQSEKKSLLLQPENNWLEDFLLKAAFKHSEAPQATRLQDNARCLPSAPELEYAESAELGSTAQPSEGLCASGPSNADESSALTESDEEGLQLRADEMLADEGP